MNMHEPVFASCNDFFFTIQIYSIHLPPFIHLYFIWTLNTHTYTHIDVNMDAAHSVQGACKQLPFHWQVHSLVSSSHSPMLLLLPGANQRQPQALWTLKGPLRWIADRQHNKLRDDEGTHDGRRRNIERGMYDRVGACRCPVTYLTPLRCLNGGNCLFRVSNLYVSDICHVAFMNPLCLTDYTLLITMEVWGPEEMLLKIKGSGDVKVVSRVIRHQRLQLQPVMSARQAD